MWVAFVKIPVLDIVLTRTVNILTTNGLVKLTMLWTTGPWSASTFAVWSESSLGTFWIAKVAKFLHADSQDTDQIFRLWDWSDSSLRVHVRWHIFTCCSSNVSTDRKGPEEIKETGCRISVCTFYIINGHFSIWSTVNALKFQTLYSLLFWPKLCFLCTCFLKYLVEWQTM